MLRLNSSYLLENTVLPLLSLYAKGAQVDQKPMAKISYEPKATIAMGFLLVKNSQQMGKFEKQEDILF